MESLYAKGFVAKQRRGWDYLRVLLSFETPTSWNDRLDNGRKAGEDLLDTTVAAMAKEVNTLAATKVMTTFELEKPSKKPVLGKILLTRIITASTLDTSVEDSNNG
jgi:hypothetical protein